MITRRDLLVAVVAIGATAAVMTLAQSVASKPLLKSSVFNWSGMTITTTATGERRQVFDTPTVTLDRITCHITTVNPGEASHAPHKHPEEELMIVREGSVQVVQEGVTNQVDAGGIIFCASNEMHGLRNIGSTRATYYVLKWFPHDLAKVAAR